MSMIQELRDEVESLKSHHAVIQTVYDRYRSVEADLLSRWFAANDTAAVDCWQAIKEAVWGNISMREKVIVKTAWDGQTRQGDLFIEADGLPGLDLSTTTYRPWDLPAAWHIEHPGLGEFGPLFNAWLLIESAMQFVASARREADADDRDRAQQREIDNRIAMEVDERREHP